MAFNSLGHEIEIRNREEVPFPSRLGWPNEDITAKKGPTLGYYHFPQNTTDTLIRLSAGM